MRYEENSLFFKDRYKAEIEKILSLEEMYKSQYKKTTLKDSNFSLGIEKTISDKKEMLFLNFLMLKVIEELLYKEKATQEILCLDDILKLKMHIYDDSVIFKDTKYLKEIYITFNDFRFKKNSLLGDLLDFAERRIPEGNAREKLISNIKNDFAFIEKLKIEEKIEPLITTDNDKKQRRI